MFPPKSISDSVSFLTALIESAVVQEGGDAMRRGGTPPVCSEARQTSGQPSRPPQGGAGNENTRGGMLFRGDRLLGLPDGSTANQEKTSLPSAEKQAGSTNKPAAHLERRDSGGKAAIAKHHRHQHTQGRRSPPRPGCANATRFRDTIHQRIVLPFGWLYLTNYHKAVHAAGAQAL